MIAVGDRGEIVADYTIRAGEVDSSLSGLRVYVQMYPRNPLHKRRSYGTMYSGKTPIEKVRESE
jgi:hypothetical protein